MEKREMRTIAGRLKAREISCCHLAHSADDDRPFIAATRPVLSEVIHGLKAGPSTPKSSGHSQLIGACRLY